MLEHKYQNHIVTGNVNVMYAAVPAWIKEDLIEALLWARQTLTDKEGSGHHFEISADRNGALQCSFCKAEWSADHCSKPMDSAAEAVVLAVCEYLSGA